MHDNLARLIFFLGFASLFYYNDSNAQEQQEEFPFNTIGYLNAKNGLNGNEVYWINQDRQGYIWITTETGLNRYDGYSFKFYPYTATLTAPYSSGQYWGIAEDDSGRLWIPSTIHGLLCFDKGSEKFKRFEYQENNLNSLSDNNVFYVLSAQGNILWLAYSAAGISKFDLNNSRFTHYQHNEKDSQSISSNYLYALAQENFRTGSNQELWIINQQRQVECFNTHSGKVTARYDFPYADSILFWSQPSILNISGIRNGIFWMGSSDDGIFGFNVRTRNFIHIPNTRLCVKETHVRGFYHVLEDRNGNLWTTNDNNEIVYYESSTKRFYYYQIESNNIEFKDLASLLYEDRSGRVWISSANGIVTVNTRQKKFTVCRNSKNNPASISGNLIYSIQQTRQGQLLVSSDHVDIFDPKNNSFKPFFSKEDETSKDLNGNWTTYEDDNGILWFVGIHGILSYDPKSKKTKRHKLKSSKHDFAGLALIGINKDNLGKYWISSWGLGLINFDPETDSARVFIKDSINNESVTSDLLGPIYKDSNGILYIYGERGGFITMNPVNETFRVYRYDPKNPNSVSNEFCHGIIENKNGLIWFATLGGGINVFDPGTEKFKSFTTADGLPDNFVVSMIADKNGNYWVGSAKGISCFTPPENPFDPQCKIKFINYDVSDGIASDNLNKASAFCDKNGIVYFGTRGGGLFYFHPDDLADNNYIPQVVITGVSILNKDITDSDSSSILKDRIGNIQELSLTWKQNIISFTFSALSYINSEDNHYAYMLEGFDNDWILTGSANRTATYTNLEAGTYTFKVKGSNNDGFWNQTPATILITITPPFWKTSWFRILIFLFVAGLVYAFYHYRISQILLLQRIRNKIAADLHDDIGSTLNSISVYSEVARKDENKRDYALTMIGESSRKIIDSLSDIVWSINPENDSLDKIITRMRTHTHHILHAKKIDFTFKTDERIAGIHLPMEIRRNFYLIFKEALNNLVKYSRAQRATVMILNESNSVSFIIRDDGIGFDPKQEFNGNGLKNMKHRASEIRAQLVIDSTINRGTQVELTLKL